MQRPRGLLISSVGILSALLCLPVAGLADVFQSGGETFQYITLSQPGFQDTVAYSINNLGEVVGYAYDAATGDSGFTYNSNTSQYSSQSVAGAYNTDLYGVNGAGTIAGSYYNQAGTVVNALVIPGGVQQLPGLAQSEYYGINNSGQIVGVTYANVGASNFTATGFFQQGANFTTVNYPGSFTYPHGVNNSDAIVGFYSTNDDLTYTAFLETNAPGCASASCFMSIGLPGSYSSFAYGINDSGVVVGASENAAGVSQGFLFNGGAYTVIDIPGAADTYVSGINDQGQIVGWYQTGDGTLQAFEASPVPEPSFSRWQAAVLLAALAGCGIYARRRRLA